MKKSLITAAILAASTSSAMAEDSTNLMAGTYAELGYTSYKVDNPEYNMQIPVLQATLGKNLNEYFAIEGFLGTGLSSDRVFGIDFQINYSYGLNVKGSVNLIDSLSAFAKIGYMWSEIEASGYGYTVRINNDGFLGTLGLEYDINDKLYTSASYSRYESVGNDEEYSLNLNIGYNF